MPGWLKILLIVLLIIILLVVGVVGAGVFWFYRNKDALKAKLDTITTEARDVGKNTDNQGCVNETISRYKGEPGITSAMSNAIFVRVCLDSSRETPGFCDSVPKQREFTRTAQWRKDQCQRAGLEGDSYCESLFTPVQQFCDVKSGR